MADRTARRQRRRRGHGREAVVEIPKLRVALPLGIGDMPKKFLARMSQRQFLSRHVVGTNRRKPIMTAKLDPFAAAPSLMKDWHRTSLAISSSLDPSLSELVKIRASQINGCANCLNMHTVYARENGETEQRIYLLSAWREAPCYTDRERAALGWTEALTRLSEGHTHESAYGALKAQFTEEEQVKLTLMINVINGWNRIAVGFGGWADPAAVKSAAKAAAA
jgi:AhpD family alkylhydroperoxidase